MVRLDSRTAAGGACPASSSTPHPPRPRRSQARSRHSFVARLRASHLARRDRGPIGTCPNARGGVVPSQHTITPLPPSDRNFLSLAVARWCSSLSSLASSCARASARSRNRRRRGRPTRRPARRTNSARTRRTYARRPRTARRPAARTPTTRRMGSTRCAHDTILRAWRGRGRMANRRGGIMWHGRPAHDAR